MPFTIIVSLAFIILTDFLFGYRLKKWFQKKGFKTIYLLHSLLFILCVLVIPWVMSKTESPERHLWTSQLIAVIFLFYVPKLLYLVLYGLGYLFKKHLPSLFHIVDFTARGIAIILFIVQLYSITGGRYNYKITNVEVPVTHLPASFDGFKIVQLSDIHLGSYGKNYKGISRLVEEVNGLHPDLIVFTGDMVNNMASEMPHWIPVLRQLYAPYGKYAVTGNHDYAIMSVGTAGKPGKKTCANFIKTCRQWASTCWTTPMSRSPASTTLCGSPALRIGAIPLSPGMENWMKRSGD